MRIFGFLCRLAVATLLLAAAGGVSWSSRFGFLEGREAAEVESVQELRRAASWEQLQEAVGCLGLVLRLPNGSWIAIRYRDSHATKFWSSAVALDSEGKWFVSRYHYCGNLAGYRWYKENRGATPKGPELPLHTSLRAIEGAATLDEARHLLTGLGFEPLSGPGQPAFTGAVFQ
jgi:hypothetical protein